MKYNFQIASATNQGMRPHMEDEHIIYSENGFTFLGVYDGHGGKSISEYCKQNLHKSVMSHKAFKEGNYKTAFEESFMETDKYIEQNLNSWDCGSTACCVLITPDNTVIYANLGDSRCILGSNRYGLVGLSADHKPTSFKENVRIYYAKSFVAYGRIAGSLAVSRAFGDHSYKLKAGFSDKEQPVIAFPDVDKVTVYPEDDFILIASDGLWDMLNSEEVYNIVKEKLQNGLAIKTICDDLASYYIPGEYHKMPMDNVTVILIKFESLVK